MKVKLARGADALEVARTRFNDYGPLLRLHRYDDARALLLSCRAVFEDERDIEMLGKVYGALADLEDKTGGRAAAVRFEEVALGYSYQAGEPENCAISHNNLANYLERQGADPATVLAHRLAAATIRLQMQSGHLSTTVRNLANSDLPPAPPAFADVAQARGGHRGRALPGAVRALAPHRPRRRRRHRRRLADGGGREETPGRREAETRRGAGRRPPRPSGRRSSGRATSSRAALRAALAEMPEAEATALKQRLREAGLIRGSAGPDMTQVLQKFEPLLQGHRRRGEGRRHYAPRSSRYWPTWSRTAGG